MLLLSQMYSIYICIYMYIYSESIYLSRIVECVLFVSSLSTGSGWIGKAICFVSLPVDEASTPSYMLRLPLITTVTAEKNRDVLLTTIWASAKFITLSASK